MTDSLVDVIAAYYHGGWGRFCDHTTDEPECHARARELIFRIEASGKVVIDRPNETGEYVVFHRDDFDRIIDLFRRGKGELALLGEAEVGGKVVIDKACEVEPQPWLSKSCPRDENWQKIPYEVWGRVVAPAGTTKVYVVREP